jgi:hypothetical protein
LVGKGQGKSVAAVVKKKPSSLGMGMRGLLKSVGGGGRRA